MFCADQYLIRMDPISFLSGTGGPKTSPVPPLLPVCLFVFFRLFNTENDVLLIKLTVEKDSKYILRGFHDLEFFSFS